MGNNIKDDNSETLIVKLVLEKSIRQDKKQSSIQKYLAKIDDSTFMKIIKISLWSGGIALFLSKAIEVFLGKSIANEDMLNKIEIITVFGITAVLLVAWVVLDVISQKQCAQESDQENENPSSHLSNVTLCDTGVQTDSCLDVS